MKKKYSKYENLESKRLNKIPVTIGSAIVAYLSDYERLPKYVKNHKRESIVVLKDTRNELGVVYIHGLNSSNGKTRGNEEKSQRWYSKILEVRANLIKMLVINFLSKKVFIPFRY